MRLKMIAAVFVVPTLLSAALAAQTTVAIAGARDLSTDAAAAGPPQMFLRTETMDAAPVKGAPFCATVTVEHTQQFADGNRIHTADNSTLCRDSQGRTRRESSLNLLGAAAQMPTAKIVTITDPIAGYRYMLDPEHKIAHRMPLGGPAALDVVPGPLPRKGERVVIRSGMAGPNVFFNSTEMVGRDAQVSGNPAAKTENLGDESIDGIQATGTREVTTIPAGKMGNERPITISSERWYSPDLKVTVMSKHTDPWAGELKTQLTNVNTAEPDPSLFAVPSDYKVEYLKGDQFPMRLPDPPSPQ
jgi:hypothetical protein